MADLKTTYKDDVLNTSANEKRKYNMITNEDGTVSLVDVTDYSQVGDSFGAADINATNKKVNELNTNLTTLSNALNGNVVLVDTGTNYRTLNTNIKLSDSLFNYGFLVVEIGDYSEKNNQYSALIPLKNQKVGGYFLASIYMEPTAYMSMAFKIIDNTHIQIVQIKNPSGWGTTLGLNTIYGL